MYFFDDYIFFNVLKNISIALDFVRLLCVRQMSYTWTPILLCPEYHPGLLFSPGSNTCICLATLLVLFLFPKHALELQTRALSLQGMSLRKPAWPTTKQRRVHLGYLNCEKKFIVNQKANLYHNSHLARVRQSKKLPAIHYTPPSTVRNTLVLISNS